MTEEMLARKLGEGESQKLEFKESFGSECIETACAFVSETTGLLMLFAIVTMELPKKSN